MMTSAGKNSFEGPAPEYSDRKQPVANEQEEVEEIREQETNEKETKVLETEEPFDFSASHTDNFTGILQGLNISLVCTSYQSQKLFFVRTDGSRIDINYKSFPRPMGLAVNEQQITLGTFTQILRFKRNDSVIDTLEETGPVDACFIPNISHTTGMINIHDIAYGKDGLWITNSAFSCLATIEPDYSFVPRWKPPFISQLKPEDRCHLNGMALRGGRPRYVTTFNQSDVSLAWRESRHNGTVMDVDTDRILLDGLIMPHSPRYYQGKLYFCESGKGLVYRLDPESGQLMLLARLQGFTRGIDFYGPLMFVGLSKVRHSDVQNPAPIGREFSETFCGIWIIHLEQNAPIGFLRFEGDVSQIYDIAVLNGIRFPELIEPDHEQVRNIFIFPQLVTDPQLVMEEQM